MDRYPTDELPMALPGHGQALTDPAWSVTHPSGPIQRPRPTIREVEAKARVKRRPHRKYGEPSEMWAWHWVRMRVVLAWVMVGTSSSIVVTATSVILHEFW
jgi:hypothetical protein